MCAALIFTRPVIWVVIQSIVLARLQTIRSGIVTAVTHNGYRKTRSRCTISCGKQTRSVALSPLIKLRNCFVETSAKRSRAWAENTPLIETKIWSLLIIEKNFWKRLQNEKSLFPHIVRALPICHCHAIPRKLRWKTIWFVNIPTAHSNSDKVYE